MTQTINHQNPAQLSQAVKEKNRQEIIFTPKQKGEILAGVKINSNVHSFISDLLEDILSADFVGNNSNANFLKMLPFNITTKHIYKNLNLVKLYLDAIKKNYKIPAYLTFKQIKEKKLSLMKGAKAVKILVPLVKKEINEKTQEEETIVFGYKSLPVFSLCLTNFDVNSLFGEEIFNHTIEDDKGFIFENYKFAPKLVINSNLLANGIYLKFSDGIEEIRVKNISYFNNSDSFYSTIYHELIHSTNSYLKRKFFHIYNFEELVAEIGACLISKFLNLNTYRESVSYLKSYYVNMEDENQTIFYFAALEAVKAVSFILSNQKKEFDFSSFKF